MTTRLARIKRPHTQSGMLTPRTLRAARALLGWSRDELAAKSGTAIETIQWFEARGSDPKLSTLSAGAAPWSWAA